MARLLVIASIVFASMSSVAGEEPPQAAADSIIDLFLDSFPTGQTWQDKDRRVESTILLMMMSDQITPHLQSLFDTRLDPLYAPGAGQLPKDRAALLAKRRQLALTLLGQLDGWEFGQAFASLDEQQKVETIKLLDGLCDSIRPAVYLRALALPDAELNERVLGLMNKSNDLRFADNVTLAVIDTSNRCWNTVEILRRTAGQRDLMRKIIDARLNVSISGISNSAYCYEAKAGDDYAVDAAIACIREANWKGEPAEMAAMRLPLFNKPKAREAVVGYLKNPATPAEARVWLLLTVPDFYAEERVPFCIDEYKKDLGPNSPYRAAPFLRWLRKNGNRDGGDLARAAVTWKRAAWEKSDEEQYLLWCGDKETIERVTAAAVENDTDAGWSAIYSLMAADLWDHLPKDLQARVAVAMRTQNRRWAGLLSTLQNTSRSEALPILAAITSKKEAEYQARTLMVKLGDRESIPRLKQALPITMLVQRVPAIAALYRAGEADQLSQLIAAAKTLWLRSFVRQIAVDALADGPAQCKAAAAAALAELLLDRSGDVSDAAYRAICRLSGIKDTTFEPWADDATRKAQAKTLVDWAASVR